VPGYFPLQVFSVIVEQLRERGPQLRLRVASRTFREDCPMSFVPRFVLVCLVSTIAFTTSVPAQDRGPVHRVTYIEALPAAAERAGELLAGHAEASRREAGNIEFLALRRIGRQNHFAILETWADQRAYEAHRASSAAERFVTALSELVYSPPDSRPHTDLLTAESERAGPAAVYVLTHVDVIPPNTEATVELLGELAADSRAEAGNARFDVLVTERTNHMTVVEAWDDAEAHDRHLATAQTRRFRSGLAPFSGALYDERLYRLL
jgi:quinol monooxygenase YgiN